uniref:Uncharacterized protein n=1 Tax=Cacopsylla melanoneura TaxID=428564 RepID=A0A8D9E0Z3_9HEMI
MSSTLELNMFTVSFFSSIIFSRISLFSSSRYRRLFTLSSSRRRACLYSRMLRGNCSTSSIICSPVSLKQCSSCWYAPIFSSYNLMACVSRDGNFLQNIDFFKTRFY